MKSFIYAIVMVGSLASCTTGREKKEQSANDDNQPSESITLPEDFSVDGDSVVLPEFEIEVALSSKAEKKLAADKETIIVQAYLSGMPPDSSSSELINVMGEINLASRRVELQTPGVAKFVNVKVSKKAYALLADKNFQVLINVFSGRRSSDMNLLDCEILQEPVLEVKAKKHTLKGKLIGE